MPTAKKIVDIYLAEVRVLEIQLRDRERFSIARAEGWADALRTVAKSESSHSIPASEADAEVNCRGDHDVDGPFLRSLIYDEAKKAPDNQRTAFLKVATAKSLPLSKALEQYIEERSPGNPHGTKPLGKTSATEVITAVNYLCAFSGKTTDTLFLDDITPDLVSEFRYEFLPKQKSKKTGRGLSPATVSKLVGMLRGLWRWALARKKVTLDGNPFKPPEDDLPKVKKPTAPIRDQFTPEETCKVLKSVPQGDRLGDLFRVGLVTGARVSEIAKVTVGNASEDGDFFFIAGGKTDNAKRVVPVPEVAQSIIARLRAAAIDEGEERLFYTFPINAATGTAKSASKAFTGLRRKVLGRETDERLSFHSLRHTWKTLSRRAGLSIDDTHDLGGWAGVQRTSSPYDHGLSDGELAAAQEKVASLMFREGYLAGF